MRASLPQQGAAGRGEGGGAGRQWLAACSSATTKEQQLQQGAAQGHCTACREHAGFQMKAQVIRRSQVLNQTATAKTPGCARTMNRASTAPRPRIGLAPNWHVALRSQCTPRRLQQPAACPWFPEHHHSKPHASFGGRHVRAHTQGHAPMATAPPPAVRAPARPSSLPCSRPQAPQLRPQRRLQQRVRLPFKQMDEWMN